MVKIYLTPVCPYCSTIKDWFEKNNVEYEEIDVSSNEVARQFLIDKTNQMNVPVVEVGGEFVVGFDREKLSKLLDIES